jgi:uncharacterized protein (TIGR00369 family)
MSAMNEEDAELSEAMGLKGRYPGCIEFLGITFDTTDNGDVCIRLPLRDELRLHHRGDVLDGAIISAMMDVIGGTVIAWRLKDEVKDLPLQEQAKKFSRISTINLRVDYLRPARGKVFTATGTVLRGGSRIAVTRMEVHNEEQRLIAVGTGTYNVG